MEKKILPLLVLCPLHHLTILYKNLSSLLLAGYDFLNKITIKAVTYQNRYRSKKHEIKPNILLKTTQKIIQPAHKSQSRKRIQTIH